jgi:ureidoglycolate hydrolase
MHSDELLIPIGADCLVYVGPPEYPDEPDRLPDLERFKVFRLRDGQGVLLGKAVWHGAPMALDKHLNVTVLLLKDTGKVDGHLVRFEDTPVQIER